MNTATAARYFAKHGSGPQPLVLRRPWHEGGDIQIGGQPEPHKPVVSWMRSGINPAHSIYSDRLRQWDWDKHNALCQKHFGNQGHYWDNRSPESIEAFLSEWVGKPVTLCLIQHEINVSNGYPLWRFDYVENTPAPSTPTREADNAGVLAATHLISIWALTEMGEFADSAADYQSAPMGEDEARADYLKLTYASAAALTPYENVDDWCPGYLISLDKLDDDGFPVCQEGREVFAPSPSPLPPTEKEPA